MAVKHKVLLKLLQADLITSEERERAKYLSDVVELQRRKSLEVMNQTALILKANECLNECRLLSVYTVLTDLQRTESVTSAECEMLNDDKGMFGSETSPEMMVKTAKLLLKTGFSTESEILEDHALLTKLQQANLITSEEREGLTDPSDVAKVQSSKSAEVMDDTAHIMRKFKHQRFQRASSFLSVLIELQQADLITSEERECLNNLGDLVRAQCCQPLEVLAITVDLLRRYGCEEEFHFLAVVLELQQDDLISSEHCKKLTNISHLVRHQREKKKPPETMIKSAEVLRRHGFEKMSKLLLVSAVTPELQNAKLITRKESKRLNDVSDLVGLQSSKSPEEMAKTADILRRYGFKGECKLLNVRAVLAELGKACLINTKEQKRMRDPVDVVRVQSEGSKTPEIMLKTADCLKKYGFEKESKFITVRAVFRDLQQADLITSEEYKMLRDISDVVKVQSGKSFEIVAKTAATLRRFRFEKESRFLSVLFQLQDNFLITSEEREEMTNLDDVLRVQRCKHSTVMFETADILSQHGFQEFELQFLSALTDLQQADLITGKEGKELSDVSDVVAMQCSKSLEMKAKSADILRRHGYTENAELLSTLVSLEEKGVVFTADEHVMLRDPSCVAGVLSRKNPEMMNTTAGVLKAHGFEEDSRFISVLANLRQAGLISNEECKRLRDCSDLIRMQSSKSPEKVTGTADVLKAHNFTDESELLTDAAILHKRNKERPTMELLSLLVVPKVSSKWKEVGLHLGLSPNRLQMIEQQHNMMTEKDQCTVMFKKWLYGALGTGEKSRSWESVLLAVANGHSKAAEKEIKESLREVAAQTAVEQPMKPQKVMSHMDQFIEWREQQLDPSQAYRRTVDRDKIPIVFRWKDKGYDVCVCTSFTGWSTKLSLTRSHHGDFTAIVELPEGTHEYKFYVDGKWIQDPLAEVVHDKLGSYNNVVNVTRKDVDAFHSSDIRKQPISGYDLIPKFEEQYSKVVQKQATVTLQITKCTTIGPPRQGKTCLKRLLTGKRWTDEETASTNIMEAPTWVECYGMEEGAAEMPWKLLSNEQQQGELFRAVLTSTTTTPDATPIAVQSTAPATPTEALHSTMPGNASSTNAASGSPLSTVSSSDKLSNTPLDAPSTTSPSDTPPTATPCDAPSTTAQGVSNTRSRMLGVDAIACACSHEALQDFLSDEEGKVLGEVSLIHFIDTGGQAIYHDIHPALVTSPSVYLVVFSLEDLYKAKDEQLTYFQSELILGPLRSICAFGTKKPQQKGYLKVHPETPRIFIIGTHLDQISMKEDCEGFLTKLHERMSASINRNSFRQFVQYDRNGRSFWTVDNTQAGKEQDKDVSKYISKLRRMIRDKSMEMSVTVPLPWFLLKVVMDSKGFHYCKYSYLLEEARCRGYVREDSPRDDLDSMLRVFHILGLVYHKVPRGYKKEDSLVFTNPDCLYSSISDFLMAAKAEVESSQAGSSEEDQGQFQAARKEEKEAEMDSGQQELNPKGIISKEGVIERVKVNAKIIKDEMEEVLEIVEAAVKKIDQEPTEVYKVLAPLHEDLKKIGQAYMSATRESKDVSSMKDKRQMLVGGLVHSLANAVHDSRQNGEVQHIKKAVKNCRTQYQGRSINSPDLEQFLAILTDLRIVAKLKDTGCYVVPAALPHSQMPLRGVTGRADPILVTMVSQTILEVSYLPSGLFCCLISELVTGLGWTVIPLGRTHVAFKHKTFERRVHLMEQSSFIKIQIESHKYTPLQELVETCHTVRRSIHESIIRVGINLYSDPTTGTVLEDSIVWGFQCKVHDSDLDEPHVAAFQEDEYESWTECLLPSSDSQEVTPEQLVWFSSDLDEC